jgi:hypothetical protein
MGQAECKHNWHVPPCGCAERNAGEGPGAVSTSSPRGHRGSQLNHGACYECGADCTYEDGEDPYCDDFCRGSVSDDDFEDADRDDGEACEICGQSWQCDNAVHGQIELANATARGVKFPHVRVQLTGTDGNTFSLLGKVTKEMKREKVPTADITALTNGVFECKSYEETLSLLAKTVDVH